MYGLVADAPATLYGSDVGAAKMVLVDRLSSALPGLSLLLLVALGCNIILSLIDHHDQQKSMAKESPMKATKKDRLRKIARGITPGILTTVANVASAAALS
jgi:hypothetical protein